MLLLTIFTYLYKAQAVFLPILPRLLLGKETQEISENVAEKGLNDVIDYVLRDIRISNDYSILVTDNLDLFDVVLADEAYSETSFAFAQAGIVKDVMESNKDLNNTIKKAAESLNVKLNVGRIHSSDVFYRQHGSVHEAMFKEHGCLAVEMESFALFHNANVLGKKAACILTISDSLVTHEETTAEERQTTFTQMMEIALRLA